MLYLYLYLSLAFRSFSLLLISPLYGTLLAGLDGLGLIVRGSHTVSIDAAAAAGANRRAAVAESIHAVQMNVAPLTAASVPAWLSAHHANYTGLVAPLPANVHLLTVHSLGPSTLLLRLSHSFEVGEDATLSGNVTIHLAGMFADFDIVSAVEMTVSGCVASSKCFVADYQPRAMRLASVNTSHHCGVPSFPSFLI